MNAAAAAPTTLHGVPRRHSLRSRLSRLLTATALGLAGASLVTVLLVGWFFEAHRIDGDARSLALTTAYALEAPLSFEDRQAAGATLSFLRARDSVEAAWLHDAQGEVFARYRRASEQGVAHPDRVDDGFARVAIEVPVMVGQEVQGRLVLQVSRRDAYRQLALQAVAILFATAGSLALALLVLRRLAAEITRPVAALATTAAAISAQRDYSQRLAVQGRDEVAIAMQAFNAMLGEVEARDEALAASARMLEARVAARTLELAEEKDRAEAASKAKTRFLANMSHELRTPLNAVLGAVQLLQQARDDGERAHLTETIGRSGASLLGLIENVLDLSRIESGKLELEAADFNLADCIEAAVATAAVQARANGLVLTAIIEPSLAGWRHGDAVRVRQVVLNLLGNAVKFTPKGEVVLHAVARDDDAVEVAVRDTGVGVDLANCRDIFEPFAQADESTTRRFGGTGLGLSISRQLARAMGGDVEVASVAHQGATFTFRARLPRVAVPALSCGLRPEKVVYFEPHEPSAQALDALLQRMGIQGQRVHGSADLETALSRFPTASQDPDGYPWLLVAADSAQAWPVLEAQSRLVRPERVISMNQSESHAVEMARQMARLPRSVVKPVLRAALASRFGARALPEAPTAVPVVADRPVTTAAKHVLVVEDDATNQMIVMSMLRNAGYAVSAVDDGRGALEALRHASYDVVLMDWQMPDMDGLEVTRGVRAGLAGDRSMRVPIVALTANAFAEDRAACLAVGMNDFLTKPVHSQTLLATVQRWSQARRG